MVRRDRVTMDIFEWEPPQVAVGYDEDVAGRGELENKVARVISRALRDAKDAGHSRPEIATAMAAYLGRSVSTDMLDKWASEASSAHRIPIDAFIALIHVTDAEDLLGFIPAMFGFAVVPERYTELIEMHLIEEHEHELAAHKAKLQAKWRSRR